MGCIVQPIDLVADLVVHRGTDFSRLFASAFASAYQKDVAFCLMGRFRLGSATQLSAMDQFSAWTIFVHHVRALGNCLTANLLAPWQADADDHWSLAYGFVLCVIYGASHIRLFQMNGIIGLLVSWCYIKDGLVVWADVVFHVMWGAF